MSLGAVALMVELLIVKAFLIGFIGWSVYPLVVLALFGGLLIYLGINSRAREVIERKFFI